MSEPNEPNIPEDAMQLISKVSARTGIPVDTLRMWCKTGKLGDNAELRDLDTGKAWYTSVAAARAYQTHRKMGRPPKIKP